MAHGDNKSRDVNETKSFSSPRIMLAAAIVPPIGFTLYVLAMFLLLWWLRKRTKRQRVVQNSPIRGSVDLEGERDDIESKQYQPRRRPVLTFASSILVPMSPSINSATPLAAPSRGYSGVMSISPVPSSPPLSPTSPISPLGSSPLVPLRATPQLADNSLPTGKPSASRNSRFRISVPAFVGRLSGGGIPITTGGGGGGGSGNVGAGTGGLGGAGGFEGTRGEGEGEGGARRNRRQSRADPVLPRMATPSVRFNSNDMIASRRPKPPSISQHIMHSPRVTAATAALLASTTPPPPNSPLPPTPLTATLTSASPLSPMPPTPTLSILPRCVSPLSKMREKMRVRPLPPLPLQRYSSVIPPRVQLPPASQPPQPPPQSQPRLLSPQAVTTSAAAPSAPQAIVLQPNRLHLPEKEKEGAPPPPPHSSSLFSRPSQGQNYPFTRLVGHRRRRAQDNDSPPPYTSQYLDSDNDNDNDADNP